MPDALAAIEALLAQHVEETSVIDCNVGARGASSYAPSATLSWEGGKVRAPSGSGTARDTELRLNVRISGASAEQARQAGQEVAALWFDAARFAELSALGVLSILPDALELPSGDNVPTLCTARFAVKLRLA